MAIKTCEISKKTQIYKTSSILNIDDIIKKNSSDKYILYDGDLKKF